MMLLESLAQASFTMLRQANRKHDLVAVQVTDPRELELPELGRLVFQDAETGEIVEVNTGDARKRKAFAERQAKEQEQICCGCSARRALTQSSCARTRNTARRWANFLRTARNGGCADDLQTQHLKRGAPPPPTSATSSRRLRFRTVRRGCGNC